MSQIPLFKVFMAPEAPERVREVLQSGFIGQGPQVEAYEREFAELVESPRPVLSMNSCTSALTLAYHLLGIGPGDEVITTPVSCLATNLPFLHCGAKIVWADVCPWTGNIDPEDVGQKVTERTKAIVAVDWGGQSCDYTKLRRLGVPIVQDAAHSLLTRHHGKSIAESGGDLVCWSTQAIKNLSNGDGGMLSVPEDQYERAKKLRWFGLDRTKGDSFRCSQLIEEAGWKYQLNDIAASIARANIPYMEETIRIQRENAEWYHQRLAGVPKIGTPLPDPGGAWWLYTIHVQEQRRDDLIRYLNERGIGASPVHVRNDIHPPFKAFVADLPGVTYFQNSQLSIPCGWWVSESDRERVADTLEAWARK